jgi:REP element-mobilizing transposase RayT
MPRKPRREIAGGVFHVYARGVDRRRIFLDDLDRQLYLHLLGGVSRRQRWSCLAYCLMGNHVHLLVQTPEPNLGDGMRRLHGTYAQTFNERYSRTGHLFERRFNDRPVATVRSVATVAAYIAANPVEAHFTSHPDAYVWSSHAAIVAGTAPSWLDVDRLAALLGAEGGDGTERYLAALAARMEAIHGDEQRRDEQRGDGQRGDDGWGWPEAAGADPDPDLLPRLRPPTRGQRDEPRQDERSTAELEHARLLPEQHDPEHDGTHGLDREDHRRERRREPRQRRRDEQPAHHLRGEREQDQPARRGPGRHEVVDAQRERGRERRQRGDPGGVEQRSGRPPPVL